MKVVHWAPTLLDVSPCLSETLLPACKALSYALRLRAGVLARGFEPEEIHWEAKVQAGKESVNTHP